MKLVDAFGEKQANELAEYANSVTLFGLSTSDMCREDLVVMIGFLLTADTLALENGLRRFLVGKS